jgi:hypothetical protein
MSVKVEFTIDPVKATEKVPTAVSSKKRCPKGTRKDKKSGDCVKK